MKHEAVTLHACGVCGHCAWWVRAGGWGLGSCTVKPPVRLHKETGVPRMFPARRPWHICEKFRAKAVE